MHYVQILQFLFHCIHHLSSLLDSLSRVAGWIDAIDRFSGGKFIRGLSKE